MDDSATTFLSEQVIFESSLLGPDDLVIVNVPFFETLPHLLLTYNGHDGQEHYYINQSGKDGSLVLIKSE